MKRYEVTIIGAGLAGLYLAKLLAKDKRRVLLVDRKEDLAKGVHTTGIFVRKTFDDFDFPDGTLGRPINQVNLYSPSLKKTLLSSPNDEFRVGRMGFLYKTLLEECVSLGVEFKAGTKFCGVVAGSHPAAGSTVSLERKGEETTIATKILVGADGVASKVAKGLGLEENREWIVGYEEVMSGVPLDGKPALHCFLDKTLAPGYLAWISNDGEETHIGVGGYPSRFDPREALRLFRQEIVPQIIETDGMELSETRGGRIPVGGVLKRISCPFGLLIGDAAGAVSPLTAGGLDPCLRLSKFAAAVIARSLKTRDPGVLAAYSGSMFRKKFAKRLVMRSILKHAKSNALLEMGCRVLQFKPGIRAAERIFFRRASFPDIEVVSTAHLLAAGRKSF